MECQRRVRPQECLEVLNQNGKQGQAERMERKGGGRGRWTRTKEQIEEMKSRLPRMYGADHPIWNGKDVGYHALHAWVERTLGCPRKCSKCGTESAKRFHWANVSGEYKRDASDWIRLCPKCHMLFDRHLLARGEKNGFSKLTESDVLLIRSLYQNKSGTLLSLSKRFNVGKSCIWWIVKRITWTHI